MLSLLTSLTFGQPDWSKVQIKEHKINDHMYMLEGSGGNILIYLGQEKVLMIDSQFAPLSERIKVKIDQLSGNKEIQYLINTHFHGDHTGGNENFTSSTILAHHNVKERLSKDQFYKAFNQTVEAKPNSYWPDITYSQEMNIYFEGVEIVLLHSPNGHTDGDTRVFFPEENVVHMGDTYFKDRFPYIDLTSGGTINGLIESVKSILLFMDTETSIVPGHGALANKKELESYLKMLKTMRDRVAKKVKKKKSIEEIKESKLDKGYEEWGTGFISSEKFVDTIWTDLTRGKK